MSERRRNRRKKNRFVIKAVNNNFLHIAAAEGELDEQLMREKFSQLPIKIICKNQALSENFIRDYYSQLDWREICSNEKIIPSDELIEEFAEYIYWPALHYRNIISLKIREMFAREIEYSLKQEKVNSYTLPASGYTVNHNFIFE